MEEMIEILDKQLEISSHQKNFNLVLALATIFLVLIYALNEASFFSKFSGIISDIIFVIMIMVLIVIVIFMKKQNYHKRLLKLLLPKKLLKLLGIK